MQVFLKIFLCVFLCHSEAHLWDKEFICFTFFSWILHYTQNDDCVLVCHSETNEVKSKNPFCFMFFWILRLKPQNDDCALVCYSEMNEVKSKNPDIYNSSLKSFHKGFFSSIRASFFFLLIHFKCFSHSIASNMDGNSWYRTKSWIWYFLVNHSMSSYLCS